MYLSVWFFREMEAQEVHVGRSIQRCCDIPRSSHNGTSHPSSRSPSSFRHGWSVVATDLAI